MRDWPLLLLVLLLIVLVAAGWQLHSRAPMPVALAANVAVLDAPVMVAVAPPQLTDLAIPVAGVSAAQLVDSFNDVRGTRLHEAIDIASPAGTAVLAVADGHIAKLFLSKPGGITIYQFDSTETCAFYYAHLERYVDGLQEGQSVTRGEVIGYVGSTGNAHPSAPHLHFAIFQLEVDKRWWRGQPIDPYVPLGGGGKRQ
jgi:peptidoglycan LD-endopeptidase LytH